MTWVMFNNAFVLTSILPVNSQLVVLGCTLGFVVVAIIILKIKE